MRSGLLWLSLFCLGIMTTPLAAAELRIETNALVEAQLSRLTGSPGKRRDMRRALLRFERHRPLLEKEARRHGVPRELLAIPVIESRYRNLPESANFLGCCSGLWQIHRVLARSYGLVFEKGFDERRHIAKATDVALRHLAELEEAFGDWWLAIAAYNHGRGHLWRAIAETGEKDPWELERRGKIGAFLSKVTAAMLIMREPELVAEPEDVAKAERDAPDDPERS